MDLSILSLIVAVVAVAIALYAVFKKPETVNYVAGKRIIIFATWKIQLHLQ